MLKQGYTLCESKPSALFARYALPQMIGLLFNSVYLIVDGVFIGHCLGTDSMAAAAVSVPLVELLIAVSIAVSSGAGVIISNAAAQGDRQQAIQAFNIAALCALCIGALVVLLGNLSIHPLARLLGSTPQIHEEAVRYMRYIVTFSPFQIFSFLLGGLIRNDNRPKLAMSALALGSASNILLDYVFMYPMDMGISGAALATALGPVFSILILLPHFLLKKGFLFFVRIEMRSRSVKRIFVLGFPSFIMEFTIGMITFVYNFAIVRYDYGELGLAAYLVMGYLVLIVLTLFLGMAEGLQPIFSYFGACGETVQNQELCKFATKVFLTVGTLSYLLIALFSKQFFSLFNPGDSTLIEFARNKSLLYFCGFPLAGYNILMISFFQATQRTKKALFVSLSRSLIWPPALVVGLPLLLGREAMWFCHSLGEAITACVVILFWRQIKRKSI